MEMSAGETHQLVATEDWTQLSATCHAAKNIQSFAGVAKLTWFTTSESLKEAIKILRQRIKLIAKPKARPRHQIVPNLEVTIQMTSASHNVWVTKKYQRLNRVHLNALPLFLTCYSTLARTRKSFWTSAILSALANHLWVLTWAATKTRSLGIYRCFWAMVSL